MLELEVLPEHGLCSDQIEFILGMHFSQAVASIQSLVGVIRGVHIVYSDKEPLSVDLVINLTSDGIKLIFDPVSQRLKVILVHDLSLLKLKYSDVLFNCPEVSPTIEQIDQSFGATHPGVYDDDKRVFTLTFRGLSFEFPADTKFQPSYAGIRQKLGRLQFPPGESPRVSRMYIYRGNSLGDCAAPPLPAPRYPALYQDGVDILRRHRKTLGLRVRIVPVPSLPNASPTSEDSAGGESPLCRRDVLFGDSVQDVVSALGAPARIYYKSEDKMKIHSPNAHKKAAVQKSDFFYNYFTMGFDVLFDARTNTAKKFILHTNYPGHYNFNMYHRCQFELPIQPDSPPGCSSAGERARQYITPVPDPVTVTAFSSWEDIAEKIKPSERPVVLNRSSSTNTTNPFGSTFCYGYQDIIFEVMPNGRLASLTLYSADGGRQRLEGGQLRGHASDLLRMRGDMMHGQEHDS